MWMLKKSDTSKCIDMDIGKRGEYTNMDIKEGQEYIDMDIKKSINSYIMA